MFAHFDGTHQMESKDTSLLGFGISPDIKTRSSNAQNCKLFHKYRVDQKQIEQFKARSTRKSLEIFQTLTRTVD